MSKAAVFGAGSWGTAFALVLADAGHDVTLWGRREDLCAAINEKHENPEYLPGVELPQTIRATHEPAVAAEGAELVVLAVPTVCVLLGQGGGGAALALLPADRVLCAEHGWLSPLPPEGASTILHRTVDRAPEIAQQQGVRSRDLLRDGIVDRVVPESPDAADEPGEFTRRLGGVLEHELVRLLRAEPAARLSARLDRYRRLGG